MVNWRAAGEATAWLCVGISAGCLFVVATIGVAYAFTWVLDKAADEPEYLAFVAVPVIVGICWWELYKHFKEEV
jgi:hypothetical protein